KVVFISPPDVKDTLSPRSGIGNNGNFYDPWGATAGKAGSGIYHLAIDGTYDSQVANPYTSNAGTPNLQIGVIAWSLGRDGDQGADFKTSDDVISWQ
ncbi:MAG: hypothetical protein H0W86_10825, partial [Armatimonadetes bacterium]|nr:hypothetical protein [Armatimonadota bacterium]